MAEMPPRFCIFLVPMSQSGHECLSMHLVDDFDLFYS